MRTRLSVATWAGVLGLVVFGLLAAASASGARANVARENASTYTDSIGDSGGAPDITNVAIKNDAGGLVTFTITATGFQEQTRTVWLFIDTDKNGATGSPSGCEYLLEAGYDSTGRWWDVYHWNGTDWASMAQTPTMQFARTGDVLTFTLGKADMGGVTGFAFYGRSALFDSSDNISASDDAPDGGMWSYDLSVSAPVAPPVAVKPVVAAPVAVPAKPVAGKRMTVTFAVTRSDSGAPMSTGTMICDPSIAGKVITHAESFANGQARLSFVVPKNAKGKQLRVKVTIRQGSQSTTKVVMYAVH
jgi:hypothetical protein